MLDTLKLTHELAGAGMSREQAERVARALGEALQGAAATRADVQQLRTEIEQLRAERRSHLDEVRAEMGQLRAELRGAVGQLRADLAAAEARLRRRQRNGLAVAVVVLAAIVGLLLQFLPAALPMLPPGFGG